MTRTGFLLLYASVTGMLFLFAFGWMVQVFYRLGTSGFTFGPAWDYEMDKAREGLRWAGWTAFLGLFWPMALVAAFLFLVWQIAVPCWTGLERFYQTWQEPHR
jgi:hypothetical protein